VARLLFEHLQRGEDNTRGSIGSLGVEGHEVQSPLSLVPVQLQHAPVRDRKVTKSGVGRSSGVEHYTTLLVLGGGVKPYTAPSDPIAILGRVAAPKLTNRSFRDELPELLEARDLTLRALAREVGALDHGYLSRMLSGKAAVNVRHAERIARRLGLPPDYFPEVREARVVAAISKSPRLRDWIYFEKIKR
jgi:hypothetical protein